MIKRIFRLSLVLALIFTLTIPTIKILPVFTEKTERTTPGIIVPLYVGPDSIYWNTIIDAKKNHPNVTIMVIINPRNGPKVSEELEQNFSTLVQRLHEAGIIVLGYTATDEASKSTSKVTKDIQKYKLNYNVDGMLFDEMPTTPGKEGYYKNLNAYAKSQNLNFTQGNPGSNISQTYVGSLDNLNIYEDSGLPSLKDIIGGWHSKYDKSNFSIAAYGVDTLNRTYIMEAIKYVNYIYVTNDDLPNPWNTLPPYFNDLVAALDQQKL